MIKLKKLYKKILIESKIDEDVKIVKRTFNSVTDGDVRNVLENLVHYKVSKNKYIYCESVNLSCIKIIGIIPVYFEDCDIFDISYNKIIFLKGSPQKCNLFYCNNNQLTSLNHGPVEVEDYNCSYNKIILLRNGPKKCNRFYCNNNQLTSLKGGPKECKEFYCSNCKNLKSLKDGPKKCDRFYCYNCKNLSKKEVERYFNRNDIEFLSSNYKNYYNKKEYSK